MTDGSPPRVRGTGSTLPKVSYGARITPACAGNSRVLMRPIAVEEDHPRVCGEQPARLIKASRRPGSPPRVRGTDPRAVGHTDGRGITPACAGNSERDHLKAAPSGDHPRVCGEQSSR